MNIGMVCYASVGGSGVIATELAHALALRGHQIHVISSERPFRWRSGVPGLSFERVEVPAYPLFREPQYLLALTTTIARVSEQRRAEAAAAARVLGARWRENLGWPDGGIATTPTLIRSAVDMIRRHRPRTLAIPYWDDRHPDHVAASHVLRAAAFTSGLRRYATDAEAWRPEWVAYYFINDGAAPSFVVDVSEHYQRKREALACYASQFAPAENDAIPTRLTASTFSQLIESRDAQFGALAGVSFAEGLVVKEPLLRATLLKHVR